MQGTQLVKGRVSAAILLGGVLGLTIYGYDMRWALRGREAWLKYEAFLYDHRMHGPHPAFASIVRGIIVAAAVFGLYEALAKMTTVLFPSKDHN